MTTINKKEIQKFSNLADEWWDVNGKFKPLHMFNPIRIEYILDKLANHFKLSKQENLWLKKLNILVIICLSSTIIFAQNELNQKKENRQAQKVAFFTAKMNLNTEESKMFWPVVNEMENELKELKGKNAHGKMMLKDKKIEDLSDDELEDMMDARIQMGKEKVDILVKYHEKFKEVIPIRKLAKYYQTGTEFKKIQLERKKQHNNPGERKR